MLQNSLMGIAQNVRFYGKTAYNAIRVGRDATCRNEEVCVPMVAHVAPPGLWNTEQADLARDPLWVAGYFLDGFGDGVQEQAVDEFLIAACEPAQFF